MYDHKLPVSPHAGMLQHLRELKFKYAALLCPLVTFMVTRSVLNEKESVGNDLINGHDLTILPSDRHTIPLVIE